MLHQKLVCVECARLPSSLPVLSTIHLEALPPAVQDEAESPANTGTSNTTTPSRTAPQQQKQKTIKTHQSPPSSAEHAAVPPRPSAAAAHGVAHVDGNAAASCLPKTRPAAARFVASFASHRDPSRAVCACLYQCNRRLKCRRSLVVLALVWRQARRFASWFFGTGWLALVVES